MQRRRVCCFCHVKLQLWRNSCVASSHLRCGRKILMKGLTVGLNQDRTVKPDSLYFLLGLWKAFIMLFCVRETDIDTGRTAALGFAVAPEHPWAWAVCEKMPELVALSARTSGTHCSSCIDTIWGAEATYPFFAIYLCGYAICTFQDSEIFGTFLYCGEDKLSAVGLVVLEINSVGFVFKQTLFWKATRKSKTELSNVIRLIVVTTCRY